MQKEESVLMILFDRMAAMTFSCQLDTVEKSESQLRNYLHLAGLEVCLWGILFTAVGMGGSISLWVVPFPAR